MERFAPVLRISASLVILTCSLIVGLDFAGMLPRGTDLAVESRGQLSELLGAQVAASAYSRDLRMIRSTLDTAVARNLDLLSAGLRNEEGQLLAKSGSHRTLWVPDEPGHSSTTHARVPLFLEGRPWATLELRFEELAPHTVLEGIWRRPLVQILVFLAPMAFLSFALFMRRTLRHLDPTAVIPTRVQATLDAMAEGVLVLDGEGRIVMANAAFAEQSGQKASALLGRPATELGWRLDEHEVPPQRLPWARAVRSSEPLTGQALQLETQQGLRSFSVNGVPVLDGWDRARGAIATFDDVTELEQKTQALQETLTELEKSQDEVRLQNEELRVLARSDPLTGVSNRHAFMDAYEAYLARARREGTPVSVIMTDIDHFKLVNDTHGHQMGDEVIQRVAEALSDAVRETDAVCRYGGEEFVVVLPESDITAAAAVAERLRRNISSPGFARVPVSASFGVTSSASGGTSLDELINQADQALYASKHAGRNRVTCWDETMTQTDH